uniref:Uncharacterized protein n=1 Tax=Sander lucioperca TaxID=283035 RepID=A0A8C9Z481_SANLU
MLKIFNHWHGCRVVGTLVHSLWTCPEVTALWDGVRDTLSKVLNINVPLDPATCLLGIEPQGINCKSAQNIVTLACLATKSLILMNWKVSKANCFDMYNWLDEFLNLRSMEETASLLVYRDGDGNGLRAIIR